MRLVCLSVIFCFVSLCCGDDWYEETLMIRPLPGEFIYSEFKFQVNSDNVFRKDAWNHFDLFPRVLGEILLRSSAAEVHLSLTRGLWRTREWGYSTRPAPPGAQLWAWFQRDVNASSVDKNWVELSDALAGLMCASLRAVPYDTLVPKLSFLPISGGPYGAPDDDAHVRYTSLPRETVCTENLTPWVKLLPCDVKSGLGSLLHASNLFESAYHSLALDFRHTAGYHGKPSLDLVLTLTVVQSIVQITGSLDDKSWSLKKLYGTTVTSTCGVSSSSAIYVDWDEDPMGKFALHPEKHFIANGTGIKQFATYELDQLVSGKDGNIRAIYDHSLDLDMTKLLDPPPFTARRYVTGYGLERGGVKTEFVYNARRGRDLEVTYMQYFPWYIRVFLHTLKVVVNGVAVEPAKMSFTPGRDRERPYMLELSLRIPPGGKCIVEVKFERALLKWTEYPPDANHGFYIPAGFASAKIPKSILEPPNFTVGSMLPDSWYLVGGEEIEVGIYTETLLVSLPTPDFSMPYNVICLACTIVALAFGPLHNITTKRLAPVSSSRSRGSLLQRIKALVFRTKVPVEDTKEVDAAEVPEAGEKKPKKVLGGQKPTKVPGGPKSSTVPGGPKSSTVLGGPKSSTVLGGPKSTTVLGGRKSTVLGGQKSATVLGSQKPKKVLGGPKPKKVLGAPAARLRAGCDTPEEDDDDGTGSVASDSSESKEMCSDLELSS